MMDPAELAAAWRDVINGPDKSWVVFENGTCVVLTDPADDLAGQAVAILREHGPVHPGSSYGDFGTITLDDGRGWVVTCHHNDILTYVAPDEVDADRASDLIVGLLGRSKRGQDAEELRVVHVEDRRTQK
jgi:hypothetical protein